MINPLSLLSTAGSLLSRVSLLHRMLIGAGLVAAACLWSYSKGYAEAEEEAAARASVELARVQKEASEKAKAQNERNLAYAEETAAAEATARALQAKLARSVAASKRPPICNTAPEVRANLRAIIAESNRSMK